MALTVAQKITIAKISEYLTANAIEKGGLYAAGIPLDLPQKLYAVRKSIEYTYDLDPTDDTLTSTSNYLYSLCRFSLEAQNVMLISGTVAGIIASGSPNPYQFTVDGSSFIPTAGSSVTITSFINYNLLFVRGGITQSTVSTEPSYYSFDRTMGLLTIVPAAGAGELFQIYPV